MGDLVCEQKWGLNRNVKWIVFQIGRPGPGSCVMRLIELRGGRGAVERLVLCGLAQAGLALGVSIWKEVKAISGGKNVSVCRNGVTVRRPGLGGAGH